MIETSGHLPECTFADNQQPFESYSLYDCICDRLRACEQRVRMEDDDYAYVAAQAESDGRIRGWNEALEAARNTVEGISDAIYTHYRIDCEPPGKVDWSQHRKCSPIDDVLAAIDALREQP